MGYECQIYKTLAGNGRGKTLLFHDIRTSIYPKHTKFSNLGSYLKILHLPKWYLFPEQITNFDLPITIECLCDHNTYNNGGILCNDANSPPAKVLDDRVESIHHRIVRSKKLKIVPVNG